MTLASIREIISAALAQEEQTGALRNSFEQQIPQLQEKLLLPQQNPVDALMSFSTSYIRSVPAGLRLVTAVSKRQGFFEYAAPFLHMAEDYFLHPPEELPDNATLGALLDEAFLAHRLLEEVNDHHVRKLGRPLLPVDMTEANIIVHHLLGEEFAMRLEELVQFTASQLFGKEYIWDQVQELAPTSTGALLSSARVSDGSEQSVRLKLAS
jgi:hypothetical protein